MNTHTHTRTRRKDVKAKQNMFIHINICEDEIKRPTKKLGTDSNGEGDGEGGKEFNSTITQKITLMLKHFIRTFKTKKNISVYYYLRMGTASSQLPCTALLVEKAFWRIMLSYRSHPFIYKFKIKKLKPY